MRGEGWYKSYQREFISITCLSTGATRDPGHGTKFMRGNDKGTKVVLLSLIQNKEPGAMRDVTAPELQEVSLYQFT